MRAILTPKIAISIAFLLFSVINSTESFGLRTYPRLNPFPPSYSLPWTTLEDVLFRIAFDNKVKELEELDDFIISNLSKPCITRGIKISGESNRVLLGDVRGIFVQIFENINYATKFSNKNLKIRDPEWAEGVVGIIQIEFLKLGENHIISKIVRAEKKEIDPQTGSAKIVEIISQNEL